MSSKKTGLLLISILAALAVCLAGCTAASSSDQASSGGGSEQSAPTSVSVSRTGGTPIVLSGSSISAEGDGVTIDGSTLTITQGGAYRISGDLEGQIVVNAGGDAVQLILDGAEIRCQNGPGLYVKKAGQTVITLADGSENLIADGGAYDAASDDLGAAVYAECDLILNGGGALNVEGGRHNGIASKDHLVIESGVITVSAVNHGIRGRDSITVLDGELNISAGNDGMQSDSNDPDRGSILLEGGSFTIEAACDAIQAETTLSISGGSYQLTCGGQGSAQDSLDSHKGLKAGTDLVVTQGAFHIDSVDDAVHANGDVTIQGGEFTISTGDDGIHADGALAIHDGDISILSSYEGLEGERVEISGGNIHITASDDGINAAGGTQQAGRGPSAGNNLIDISGGWIVVSAGGDGIDSNGDINMTGGTLLVHGPVLRGDAPLDCDGRFVISGGVLVATGGSSMAQAPGDESSQASLQVYFSSASTAGTPVHLAKEDGTPILTFTPEKDFQNIVISVPALSAGESVRLYTGGSSGQATDGLALDQENDGELLLSVTLDGVVTRISDTGEAVSGFEGFAGGGGRGFGGMNGGRDNSGDRETPSNRQRQEPPA